MKRYPDTVILVFAKAPEQGRVNTRLIPDIGVQAATQLQHDMIRARLSSLQHAGLCDVRLLCSPDLKHSCFIGCQQDFSISLHTQTGNNLGARMQAACEQALQHYRYCILVGTDAPALGTVQVQQAIDCLHRGDNAVIVPAEDGGYVLLGLKQAYPCLFDAISWGTSRVMPQTIEQLRRHHICFTQLASCWDIDRYEDFLRYQREFMQADESGENGSCKA